MADEPLPESDIEDGDVADDSKRLEEVWERAMSRFDEVALPEQDLRFEALEDRAFVTLTGAQWEGVFGEQFENSPRPEIDKITKSLEKIETDFRENRLTVEYLPANDEADEDTAETLNGMHRADSHYFKAQQARDNAFKEAIRGGFGAWRLTTDYADPTDPDDEAQRVNPGLTIKDADQCVYFYDGDMYDRSDALAAFVLTADLRSIAEKKWGKENTDPWPANRWPFQFVWQLPDLVLRADYYEIEDVGDTRIILTNDVSGEELRFYKSEIEASEISDFVAKGWKRRTRKVNRKRVHKYIMNGTKVLKDCGYVSGDAIPIVPVYGRLDWINGVAVFRGHVRKRKDRQRIYNSRVAKLVETDSISPREVPIFDPEQISPEMANEWARANIDRLPFLRAMALRNPDGTIASVGPIGKVEPPQVQPATAALLQIAGQDLTDEDENADEVKANVSADAMDIAASRVDAKSGIYLDNMRQSVQREAEIYLGMAREVNFEEGRKVETLTMDGQDGTATLQEPVLDENKVYRIRNDLSRGKYKVVADVQESTTTKRQKTVRQNMEIAGIAKDLQGTQDLAAAALLNAVMNQDGEGMQDMQKFARNKLIALGVVQPTPEEQQQIAAAAEQEKEPSSADMALQAQAKELESKAQLNAASAAEKLASAHLKGAQAEAVGGPSSEPQVPSGLHEADIVSKLATADLNSAKAAHLRDDMSIKRIRTAHDVDVGQRQQRQAERQPKEAA